MTSIQDTKSINLLAKVFRSEEFMNDFLDGKIYMNCLGYFKKIEEQEVFNTVKDTMEGVISHLLPEHVEITITDPSGEKINIDSKDLAGPVFIQENYYNNLKICCFYSPKINKDDLDNSVLESRITDEMKNDFGEHVVLIYKFNEFIQRIKSLIKHDDILGIQFKKVNYYAPDFHGDFARESIPFNKQKRFEFQKESRLVVKTKSHNDKPLILDIGDIRDLAVVFKVEDFNRLDFKIKN
ncbi:hypothetical protein [Acinetobacter soli]|uniref:hypothetical protein n=1 Tax=Acinetobacter soli TaxID=487316 RepID=UPI001D0B7916|nr:hypothetical protein [Acinetobacter soli]MCB8769400.1 hypothetical protein [Acinetobacter soli]